jgi:hypothetical protein
VQASGQLGLGDGVEAEGFVSSTQDESSATITANDPIVTGTAYGIEQQNGVFQPVGDPTVSGGESLFFGAGVSWYSSVGH